MESFARANELELDDPILKYYKDGDLNISMDLRKKLAKGLYKGKDDSFWKCQ